MSFRVALGALVILMVNGSLVVALTPGDRADAEVREVCDRTLSGAVSGRGGFTVPAHQTWCFDPSRTTTVESDGNVVVHGTLRMRPASVAVTHTLRFIGIDERRVRGGETHVPVASDVGLWVLDQGVLDAQGTPRAGWNRTGTDPTWQAGDEILVAPTAVGDYTRFVPFRPASPVPTVSHDGRSYRAEVFNLSRNVRIEGTPNGRAHVMFLRVAQAQTIRYAAIRYVGPKAGKSGRYGLHFHHALDGSRGSLVEGVVVRDAGNHAFVPHASHGITFRDTVTFNTQDAPYWWDPDSRGGYPANASFDISYQHAAAFLVLPRADARASLTGFYFGQGTGNSCLDCVAVGVQGGQPASGFHWPSSANLQPNVWTFRDGVAHNNRNNGVHVGQNGTSGETHPIDGLTVYRNAHFGISQGAYRNSYVYGDVVAFGNGKGPVSQQANGGGNGITFTGTFDASGSPTVVAVSASPIAGDAPTTFLDARFLGWTHAAVTVDNRHSRKQSPGQYDFVRVRVGPYGRDLQPSDFALVSVEPGTLIRVQRRDRSAYRIDHWGNVTPIGAFSP